MISRPAAASRRKLSFGKRQKRTRHVFIIWRKTTIRRDGFLCFTGGQKEEALSFLLLRKAETRPADPQNCGRRRPPGTSPFLGNSTDLNPSLPWFCVLTHLL